ncbi:MAG: hypothetical protein A3F84_27735 [Candidatus Handelsmanbacteria bacterium RIFCSPLOWO2_12_FULL_64_10]|uniref:Uncharacterized protein n=1 Tax=Handelsmanbacteria sp. (strain RIFCSPLOWO2_12_FULL_64_10) TaxID=1817868 RepID=A0A1F6C4I7_HANXR|nr:MAG: hypothetical protein A3F84_27735 [Candidatus Handelsmanbacteria bacterium RIFCSPLOWO2_12_FULL_64_10]
MAVVLQTSGIGGLAYPFYTGLSSDEKPIATDLSNADADATFYELDTRREFVWKDRAWMLRAAPDQGIDYSDALGEIAKELRRIRFGFEIYLKTDFPDPDE